MPRICHDKYCIHEVSVSRTDQGRYPHSRANVIDPYPKNTRIIDRLDGDGNSYLDNPMNDLYNEDFLWGTSIQTAQLQNDRRIGHPKRDRVLDCLITIGVQDMCSSREPGMLTRGRNIPTSLEMRHTSSIGSWLLSRIDVLEKEVRASNVFVVLTLTNPFLQVTQEHNECKEMETAFMGQASKVEEVFQQNRDLAQRLVDLEKLWLEEKFTMELRGCVEALQVRWSLWGVLYPY